MRPHDPHPALPLAPGPPHPALPEVAPGPAGTVPGPARVGRGGLPRGLSRPAPRPAPPRPSSWVPPARTIDLGRCLFCDACVEACPTSALTFTRDHRLATRDREHLVLTPERGAAGSRNGLDAEMMRLFGRSLKLRVVSAGGCNGCEVDVNVLGTLAWDLGRFGIQFVAAPRHADAVLVCGPGHGQHGAGPAQDLRGGARPQARHRRGRLRHQRRPLLSPGGAAGRRPPAFSRWTCSSQAARRIR